VTIQNMGIRTALVQRGPLRRAIRTVGVIITTSYLGGRHHESQKGGEKLVRRRHCQAVHALTPLLTSTRLNVLHSAASRIPAAIDLHKTRRPGRKLRLMRLNQAEVLRPISDAQIAELGKTREPHKRRAASWLHKTVSSWTNGRQGQVDAGMKIFTGWRTWVSVGAGAGLRAGPGVSQARPEATVTLS